MDTFERLVADVGASADVVETVAPPEAFVAAGVAGPLPLSLRRQRVTQSRTAAQAQPLAEGRRVGVADVDDGMVVALDVGAGVAGLLPPRSRTMLPHRLLVVRVATVVTFAVRD